VVFVLTSPVQAIFQSHRTFPKFTRDVKAAQKVGYGPNLVTSEHEVWRKHRRIAAPSFTEGNNGLVWESTIEIILGYFIKWNRDGKGRTVKVPNLTEVTTQIAFMVFSTAGM
jgi:cytochrome P450